MNWLYVWRIFPSSYSLLFARASGVSLHFDLHLWTLASNLNAFGYNNEIKAIHEMELRLFCCLPLFFSCYKTSSLKYTCIIRFFFFFSFSTFRWETYGSHLWIHIPSIFGNILLIPFICLHGISSKKSYVMKMKKKNAEKKNSVTFNRHNDRV